ncbi:3'-5' exonuclease DinG [Sphingomonas sp. S2M10]|uniref:3'-5' exonuclease n=1 Tax=Sphingomonas sp. S2M10 TaxID=2705010 RepID=UPI00169A530B|nr:3'-5' exonuclease [Sphingomonas sp. S2M10]NLS26466.1 3'-5' exonuclease DinG [Sphingomonas sp. S2M10]
MMGQPDAALEAAAALLEASQDYRVLRRLQPRAPVMGIPEQDTRLGLFVDVETTGLDPSKDEIIELAMVPFRYSLDGIIVDVGEAFDRLREPSAPIPASITALTGISDAMVAGQRIDPDEVTQFALSAAVVIAHNAAFDRKFLERFCPSFSLKPWACSMSEIDWAAEGFEGTKLAYLAVGCGFFYDRHRAANDCLAAVEVLSRSLPKSGVNALGHLLARARLPTWRIWAEGSPFEFKDHLKSRGYRWNGEENGRPRAWYIDVTDEQREAELAFLKKEIYQRDVDLKPSRITAYERFSERV